MKYTKLHDELTREMERVKYPVIFNGSEMASIVACVEITKKRILSARDPIQPELQNILNKIQSSLDNGPIAWLDEVKL